MVRTLCSLDTSALTRPLWVRLSLPGRPEACAAGESGPAFRAALNRLWSRWARQWGSVAVVWKIEFTTGGLSGDRIAPHVHLLASIPDGVAYGDWEAWLADAWCASVQLLADIPEVERAAFWLHGVWSRPVDGGRLGPRAARYFAHFKPGASGRHQDQPPPEWLKPGMGIRRCWGVRGIPQLASPEQPLTDREAVWVARVVRRWDRATNGPIRVRRRRKNGRLVHLIRRHPLSRQAGGWLIVADAERIADRAMQAVSIILGGDEPPRPSDD